jgi:hypothetical protein
MPPDTFIPTDLRRQLVKALADTTATCTPLDLESDISQVLGEVGGIWPDYCRPVSPTLHVAHRQRAHRAPPAFRVISLANIKAA